MKAKLTNRQAELLIRMLSDELVILEKERQYDNHTKFQYESLLDEIKEKRELYDFLNDITYYEKEDGSFDWITNRK